MWEGRVTMHVGGEGDNACGRALKGENLLGVRFP